MKKNYLVLVLSLLLISCSVEQSANTSSESIQNNDSISNTSQNSSFESEENSSGGPFYVGALPGAFFYKEIEYRYNKSLALTDFDEEDLIAIIINPSDETKFLSENHTCDYIIYDSTYNYYDEDNRLYVYKYENYEINEYLVVFTKMDFSLYKSVL